jgi:hypothetical protein
VVRETANACVCLLALVLGDLVMCIRVQRLGFVVDNNNEGHPGAVRLDQDICYNS